MRRVISIATAILTVVGIATTAAVPAQAASTPTIQQVSNKTPLPAGGQNVTLTGNYLTKVTAVIVGGSSATIVSKATKKLVFITPAHAQGRVSITLKYPGGKYVLADSMLYKPGPSRALVPLPWIPDTLKVGGKFSMQPGNAAWVVQTTSNTPATCTVAGLIVTAVHKGSCELQFTITVDTMDPTYRSRQALFDINIG